MLLAFLLSSGLPGSRVWEWSLALKSNLVEHVSSKEATQVCELRSDNKLVVT